jgi:hypothetical protein
MKYNCWDFKHCGRQPNGNKVAELGVCPAAVTKSLDSANGGTNGGRCCWVIAGTLCGGAIQCMFARTISNCMECGFYKFVFAEEKAEGTFIDSIQLYKRL